MKERIRKEEGREWTGAAAYQQVFVYSAVYHFLYCILVSAALLSKPLIGGILYLFGRVVSVSALRLRPPRSEVLSGKEKWIGVLILVPAFLLLMFMLVTSAERIFEREFLTVFLLHLILLLRAGATEYRVEKDLIAGRSIRKSFTGVFLIQAAFLIPVSVLLLIFIKTDMALPMIGGFLLGGIWEWSDIWHDRERLRTWEKTDREEIEQIRKAHSYRMFQNLFLTVTFAAQVTMPLTYALIGLSSNVLLYGLLTASVVSVAAVFAAARIMKGFEGRGQESLGIMLVGLMLWLYGLILFFRNFYEPSPGEIYLSLALSTAGCTVCIRTLDYLDSAMRKVASFAVGHDPTSAYDWMQRSRTEMAGVAGQTLSMVLLCILEFYRQGSGGRPEAEVLVQTSPLMMVPALIAMAAALVTALRFPVTGGHIRKLNRYLKMREAGDQNEALRTQLENVLLHRSFRHYGIRIVMFVIRPFYRHRVIGRENVSMDGDASCVFVCNHGEIYGPVVTNLYVPFPFRPWVTSEMCDSQVIADYIYRNTFSKQKWIPKGLRRPFCTRLAGPVLAWIMRSVDSIPVYHGNPRQLMNTFRSTVDAMEAGDNILVFPENGGASSDGRYVREGVGEFFTGFATIGQLYYRRTGKSCRFIPIYANRRARVIQFGKEIRYNGENAPADEKERICDFLRDEILRMAGREEEDTGSREERSPEDPKAGGESR